VPEAHWAELTGSAARILLRNERKDVVAVPCIGSREGGTLTESAGCPRVIDGANMRIQILAACLLVLSPVAGTAQTSKAAEACQETARPTEAPTKTEKGPDSGSKNAGSTGWSGTGFGGSQNDTTEAGPTKGSPTEHPATAKGLDPTKPSATNPRC
jgi:hypothetical protein